MGWVRFFGVWLVVTFPMVLLLLLAVDAAFDDADTRSAAAFVGSIPLGFAGFLTTMKIFQAMHMRRLKRKWAEIA